MEQLGLLHHAGLDIPFAFTVVLGEPVKCPLDAGLFVVEHKTPEHHNGSIRFSYWMDNHTTAKRLFDSALCRGAVDDRPVRFRIRHVLSPVS